MKNKIAKMTIAMAATGLVLSFQTVRANDGTEVQQQQQTQDANTASDTAGQPGDTIHEASGAEATSPQQFLKAASQINKLEIQEGQMAQEKGQSEQVKSLAQKMVQDHQMMEQKVEALAQQKDFQLPSQLNAKHQKMVDKLSACTGTAFDRDYLNDQVKGHQKAIALFQKAAADNTDSDVKSLAQNSLPTLEQHLQMAQQDSGTINEPAGAPRTENNSGQ